MNRTILALGFSTVEDFQQRRGCAIDQKCDTIKEAKEQAKRFLTDEYQQSSEASEPLRYSQVTVNGECLYDYFRKEPKQPRALAQLSREGKL